MLSWFRSLYVRPARSAAKPPRRRPALEMLEDRCVPAVVDLGGPCLDCAVSPPASERVAVLARETTASIEVATVAESLRGSHGRRLQFETEVVARDLDRPTGIVVRDGVLYFTQVPTPGVGGSSGGQNSVEMLDLGTGQRRTLHMGEPEPRNITRASDGTLYWTCTTAGVILSQTPEQSMTNEVTLVQSGLDSPVGIALDPRGRFLYWSEIPNPGVQGGAHPNTIHRLDLRTGKEKIIHKGAAEPSDLAVDRHGNVYFTDRTAGKIVQVRPDGYSRVLLHGLDKPVGLAIDHKGQNLYFTEVPTPGVSGSRGGRNTVNLLDLRTLERTIIDAGDPEPTDIAVDRDGTVYWTCSSAGVIVQATPVKHR